MKIRSVFIAYSIKESGDEKEKTLKLENDIQILENQMNLNPTEFIQASLNQKKGELGIRKSEAGYSRGFTSSISGQLA